MGPPRQVCFALARLRASESKAAQGQRPVVDSRDRGRRDLAPTWRLASAACGPAEAQTEQHTKRDMTKQCNDGRQERSAYRSSLRRYATMDSTRWTFVLNERSLTCSALPAMLCGSLSCHVEGTAVSLSV